MLVLSIDLIRARRVWGPRLAGHVALLALLGVSIIAVWFEPRRWNRMFGHYANAVATGRESAGVADGFFDYARDLWFNLLQPAGVVIFGATIALLLIARRVKPAARLWAAAILLALIVVSFIPKKMPWYIVMPSALIPVVAASVLAAFTRGAAGRRRITLTLGFVGILAAQYVLALFVPFHSRWMAANVDPRLAASSSGSSAASWSPGKGAPGWWSRRKKRRARPNPPTRQERAATYRE
ncbi:MAG: hypothetical protein KJ042_03770 [Deltaproteobacteria bacterium]|nr:hypothetical protein [Deltaproteobacteria bacterium]